MDTLKLKIFDVLVNNITIEEFENWLYNSELLDDVLKEDSLIFDIVNINFRLDNAMRMIKNIASTIFNEEDFIVMKIEDNCNKIIRTNKPENIKNYVFNIVSDYNFDIESSVYWEFYSLHYSFDGFEYINYTKGSLDSLNTRSIAFAKTVIESLKKCRCIEDKKEVLLLKLDSKRDETIVKNIIDKTKKASLKDRVISFFR